MEAHSDLERDVFLHWIEEHRYEKDLVHWYLQQIAYEVRLANQKVRKTPKLTDFHLSFEKPKKVDPKVAQEWAKQRWFGLVGLKRKK